MNIWIRAMTSILGTLLLLAVAIRAAGSISGERSRQTLDDLLATPLENSEIIDGKWLGSVLGLRLGFVWMGLVLLVGVATGSLSWLGLSGILIIWLVYAGFFAILGLQFSTVCRNTLRATVTTLLVSLFFLGGHWIASGLACYLPLEMAGSMDDKDTWEFFRALQLGYTPSFVLGMAPIRDVVELSDMRDTQWKYPIFAVMGVASFAVATLVFRRRLIQRFGEVMSRADLKSGRSHIARSVGLDVAEMRKED
jgi:ABC-type transport system involved in multi-copper enzyme maturation permease subunit